MELVTLARSINEALILAVLSHGDMHGYQIALTVEDVSCNAIAFNHGTLYPILHALEKNDYISGEWEQDGSARKRKCYSLTEKGMAYYELQRNGIGNLFKGVMKVLGGEQS